MKNFIKKHGLTILSLVFTIGGYIVESKQSENESKELKEEIKKELLEEMKKEK